MKTSNVFFILLVLVLSACDALASAPTPTPVPLPPPQHVESAFQWLETHAMMKDNVDWTALRNDTAEIIANAKTTADTLPAICLAMRGLRDGNAWVLVPGLETPNFFTGYSTLYPDHQVITEVGPDSPAGKAGLQIGDRIEQVNGHAPIPYEDMDAYPPCNEKEIDTSAQEHLTINRDGQSIQIVVEKTKQTQGLDPYNPPQGQRLGSDSSGIGYIELTTEGGSHLEYATDVQKLMRNMDKSPVCGWMVDLRRIPGGDIWSYMAGLGPILGEGDLGGFEYSDGRREGWTYRNGEVLWNNEYREESQVDGSIYEPKHVTPVALLISPGTQAAAELMLVAFQGRPDIRSFGEPTRGLPTLVTHTVLSDGSVLFVSGANSFDRNGTIYNGPIAPDVFVETDWSKFGTEQDPVILAAMDWLQSQSACKPWIRWKDLERETMEQAPARSVVRTHLEKPWLLPVRILWLTAVLIALALFIAGLPLRAREIRDWYGGGLVVTLTEDPNGEVIVSSLWTGSSAVQAGVLQGDSLLAVDGVPITSLEQAAALIKGAIGSQVTVSVRTGTFPPRQLTVTRESWSGSALLKYGLSSQFAIAFVLSSEILFTFLCVGIASVIFWYRSDDWMALFSALIITMILVGLSLPVIAFADSLNNTAYRIWIDIWFALSFGSLILFFYLFPAGRFASRFSLGLAAILGLWLTLGLFNRSLLMWNQPRLTYIAVALSWVATGVASLVNRYRHSESFQRQQILWIVWGAAASAVGLMLQIFPTLFNMSPSTRLLYDFVLYPLGQVFKACLPISIGFAILRYRLWNIELVLNRVLVYGSLSVLTMLGYLGTVFIMQALFTGLSNPVISFFATGVVAVLFEPLRRRLQRSVNRMIYGERDDPYAVLTRLASTLQSTPTTDKVLPSIAQTIGHSLKIPYVAILLDQDGEEKLAASFGMETPDLISFPLVYQGETIGSLHVARRGPREEFSDADRRLIENIAHQAGAAAQTVRLNAELIRSRTQIVNEREDERLRIRRDLHDELGPMLASQRLKLAAARQVIRTQPEKAEKLVEEIGQQSQQTVADIRRLVHGLRPPVLDQLGLVEAVRDLARTAGNDMTIEVSAPESAVPKLSAAAEVNAYRIVLEALTNAAKHARAKHCTVEFEFEPELFIIHIQDDGVGMPKEYRAGVGLRSMRLRAAEIGGRLSIESVQPHGTHIIARLPLSI